MASSVRLEPQAAVGKELTTFACLWDFSDFRFAEWGTYSFLIEVETMHCGSAEIDVRRADQVEEVKT